MTDSQSPIDRDGLRPMWLPTIDRGDIALDVALKYAAAGWRVVPAERGSHDTNSIVKDATTNATRPSRRAKAG